MDEKSVLYVFAFFFFFLTAGIVTGTYQGKERDVGISRKWRGLSCRLLISRGSGGDLS